MEQYEINWKDYYAVLGVGISAEAEVVKAAYTALARKHHPDAGGSPPRMKEINEAWEVLSDPQRRSRYDLCRRQRSGRETKGDTHERQAPPRPHPQAAATWPGVLPWPSPGWQRAALFCSIPLGGLLAWCSFDIWATVAGLVIVAVAVFAAIATRGLSRVDGRWTAARVGAGFCITATLCALGALFMVLALAFIALLGVFTLVKSLLAA